MPTPSAMDGRAMYDRQTFHQAMSPELPRQPQHALSIMTTATSRVVGNSDESGSRVIDGYVLQQRLGSGSFATVFKGVKVLDASGTVETVAVKVIARDDRKLTKKVLENLEMEIAILRTYRHPNIVCLHNVQKTERNFYLLLEYCSGGDVQHLIRSRQTGRLSERLTRRLLRDLASGLKFLWGQELIHRDLKPQNLLLTGALPMDEVKDPAKTAEEEDARRRINFPSAKFALKIADFGFARHLQSASLAETLCGSPLYMAPEILQHNRYDAKADLWSVGTVLFEMIAGHPPFHGENHIDLLRNIQRKAVRLPPDVRVSRECVNLLRILLNRNPLTRAGFKEFFEAADAFVALGCEGQPLSNVPTSAATPLHLHGHLSPLVNLVPISEDDETSGSGHHGTVTPSTMPPAVSDTHSTSGAMQHQRLYAATQQQQCDAAMFPEEGTVRPTAAVPSPTPAPPYPGFATLHGRPIHPVQTPLPMITPLAQSPSQGMEHRPSGPMQAPRHPHFLPLVPSPPGPRALSGMDIHLQPPFSLDGDASHAVVPRTGGAATSVPYATEDLQHRSDSLQASEDGGYVMVERAVTISPASSQVIRPQQQQYHGRTPMHLQGRGTRLGGSPTQTQPSFQRGNAVSVQQHDVGRMGMVRNLLSRGILSTSPGSGRAIVGGGGVPQMRTGGVTNSVVSPTQGFGTALEVLSTAEDVGRRAVSVAHLGDTRAFIAVRHMLDGGTSSLVPMEGVVEDDTEEEEATVHAAHLSGISGSMLTPPPRRRSVSSDLSSQVQSRMGSVKVEKDDDDEDDEMPFALDEGVVESSSSAAPIIMQRASVTGGAVGGTMNSISVPRTRPRPSNALILSHFKEALSCYVKALTMLKGAVSAAQKVVSDANRLVPSRSDSGHLESLKKRALVSHGWLSGQFRGVLERADAANSEIAKLSGPKPEESQSDSPLSASTVVVSAEELIYNHCLSCGKDGAVKQLLGQHEAARSSYRSAGLLAETLLMEPRVGDEDRKVLEDYVRGFAERITELDNMLMRQSGTVSVTASTVMPPVLGASAHLGSSRRVVTTAGSRAASKEMS